jgi:NTE family protein
MNPDNDLTRQAVGLALGGGAARGWAHIGVIRALEEAKIRPAYVVGCSMGALVGAAYASGVLDELERFARTLTPRKVLGYIDPVVPVRGLLGGDVFDHLFTELLGDADPNALAMPFCAVATDLANGAEVRLMGNLAQAVRASCSIPGIFTPARQGERFLVDGGLVNPVPVDVARDMGALMVIAVDLNHDIVAAPWHERRRAANQEGWVVLGQNDDADGGGDQDKSATDDADKGPVDKVLQGLVDLKSGIEEGIGDALEAGSQWAGRAQSRLIRAARPNIFDVIGGSIDIIEAELTAINLEKCPPDLLVQPPLGHMSLWDFADADTAIEVGYLATQKALAGIGVPEA